MQGSYSYKNEAFYVEDLYVNKSGVIGKMAFNPDQWKTVLNMNPATANGFGIY